MEIQFSINKKIIITNDNFHVVPFFSPKLSLSAALRSGTRLSSSSQPSSLQTATSSSLERDLIVPAENGRIWVAWHPERDVPFEHTKPLDATQKETRMAEIEVCIASLVDIFEQL